MAVNIEDLEARVTVDSSGFKRGMDEVGRSSEDAGKRGSHALGVLGSTAALAAGGAGIALLGGAAHDVFSDMEDGDRVAAQTAAVIKSTGDASNLSAQDFNDLATSISMKSGQDDEAIQSGENMLATFKNIQNQAGANNDIFTQATGIMADMSQAMGTDMSNQAIQLGKALNDPAKGMTALQRVGVTFTDQQKEQIKTMEASGNMMGAQKVILGELSSEFGGSAAAAGQTFSGSMNIVKMTLENTAEAGLTKVMPFLAQAAQGFTSIVPQIQAFVSELVTRATPVFNTILSAVRASMPLVRMEFTEVVNIIRTDVVPIVTALGTIFAATISNIVGVLRAHQPQIQQILTGIGNLAHVLGTIFETVLLPVIKLVFEQILPRAIGVAIDALAMILHPVQTVQNAFNTMKAGVGRAIDGVVAFITDLPGRAVSALGDLGSLLVGEGEDLIRGFIQGIENMAGSITSAIEDSITSHIPSFIRHHLGIQSPSTVMAGLGQDTSAGFAVGITNGAPQVAAAAQKMVAQAQEGFNAASDTLKQNFSSMAQGALQAFDTKWAAWVPPAQRLLDKMQLQDQINQVKQAVTDAMSQLADAKTAATEARETYLNATPQEGESTADFQTRLAKLKADSDAAQAQVVSATAALGSARRQQKEFDLQLEAQQQTVAQQKTEASQRESLARQLLDLQKGLAKHPGEWESINDKIVALLKTYQVPLYQSGQKFGSMFADGLRSQVDEVQAAARALAEASAKLLKLHSPAQEGPLSDLDHWWDAFAPTLLAGLDSAGIRGALTGAVSPDLRGVGGAARPVGVGGGLGGAGGGSTTILVTGNSMLTEQRETARQLYTLLAPFFADGQITVAAG